MDFKLKIWASGPLAALAVALSVVGCGGDSSDSSSTTTTPTVTPTSSVYSGTVSGFGSVIVGGVRFDTVGASTSDDDGAEVRLEDLRIGMLVTVSGSADDSTGRGTATQLTLSHGTTGAITSINFEADTLVLLGQTVTTNTSTIYEGAAAFDSLEVGAFIEVYGVLQTDNTVLATLIEVKTAPTGIRLVGRMSALNTTAQTFKVGDITVNYASPATVTGTLGDGKRVKIKAAADALDGNVLTASSVKVNEGAANGETVPPNTYLKLEGVVDSLPDSNGLLTVSGTPVNVSSATGKSIITTVGQLIEVKGTWDGSVLQATKVEAEDEGDDRNELYGAVSELQPSSGTPTSVVVHGVTVDVSSAVFNNGKSAADLVVGSYVEIKGHVVGDVLVATKVELKTGSDAAGREFEDYGVISEFSSASSFKVDGVLVDASSARFEDGTASNLVNGAYVEIKGAQNASGVFVATKVEFKSAPG
jgi:cytoskeletal protein CcmA (bactofilin family)